MNDRTYYSDEIAGERGNYKWSVRYDVTDNGYLGITQKDGTEVKDRVLLSPKQVDELLAFAKGRRKGR